jgi:hypothetical protein
MSDEWKRGFAAAISLELATVVLRDEAPDYATTNSYKKCFDQGVHDDVVVTLIDNYVTRHPTQFATPMVGIAIQAIREACAPHFRM